MKYKYASVKHMLFTIFTVLLLSACSSTEFLANAFKSNIWTTSYEASEELSQSKGSYKVGTPYKVGRVWYYPKADFNLVETGIASWYGPTFHAKQTANGEVFNQNSLSAAHRTLQMPSFVRVTNLENGKSLVVRVNDRGPFKSGRVIDLSKKAASLLGYIDKGTAKVKLEVMEDESRFIAEAAMRGENTTSLTYNQVSEIIKKRRPQKTYMAVNDNGKMVEAKLIENKKPIAKKAPVIENKLVDTSSVPESLMTPTITVEELYDNASPIHEMEYKVNKAAMITNNKPKASNNVVSQRPVVKTGIFVQAGSFSIYDNAEKLSKELMDIAPTIIDNVESRSGQKLYRVKLGPITTVEEADNILSRVIQAGSATALIIGK